MLKRVFASFNRLSMVETESNRPKIVLNIPEDEF